MNDVVELYQDTRSQGGELCRVLYARMLREAARQSAVQWVMLEWPERLAALNAGLRRLVRAAGMRFSAWTQLPPRSKARSDVLLRGARALGIDTLWPGWD